MPEPLLAVYDLSVSPASYDFFEFLQLSELHRVRYQLGDLHVIIVSGPKDGFRDDTLKPLTTKQMLLRNVVLKAPLLLPSCKSINWAASRQSIQGQLEQAKYIFPRDYSLHDPIADYVEQGVVAASLRNESLGRFTAPFDYQEFVKDYLKSVAGDKKVLTLTLRGCSHNATEGRKANTAEWKAFFDSLALEEFQPIIVPETELVYQTIPDLAHLPFASPASFDLLFRTALYEQAYANFFTPNGTWAASRFTFSNTIMFKIIDETCHVTTENWVSTSYGINVGEQVPINPICVRWCWEQDEKDVIEKEFNQLREVIEDPKRREKKHGIQSVEQAVTHISSGLSYTFKKMNKSINYEDLLTMKCVENIGSSIGGDAERQLSAFNMLTNNIGKHLPGNIMEHVRSLEQHLKLGLDLRDVG